MATLKHGPVFCHYLVIDNGSVFLQDFFGLLIEFSGYFMDLVFMFTASAAHSYSPAHPMNFKPS